MSTNENQGVFINGKQQVIELLQHMQGTEKEKLLRNISQRNAVMAQELREKSFSFNNLSRLPEGILGSIFDRINPVIIGLALYNTPVNFQRKVLRAIDRKSAEEAFHILNEDLSAKKRECKRAQEKVLAVAIQLSRRKVIDL